MKNCHDAVTVIINLCWLYQAYSKWRATLFTHLVPVVRPSVQWVTFFTSGSYLETWKRKYLYIEKFILWLCYSPYSKIRIHVFIYVRVIFSFGIQFMTSRISVYTKNRKSTRPKAFRWIKIYRHPSLYTTYIPYFTHLLSRKRFYDHHRQIVWCFFW